MAFFTVFQKTLVIQITNVTFAGWKTQQPKKVEHSHRSMPNPKLCAAGVTLRNQVNRAFPNRDRRSDGWVGDSSHSARKSDHNPNLLVSSLP